MNLIVAANVIAVPYSTFFLLLFITSYIFYNYYLLVPMENNFKIYFKDIFICYKEFFKSSIKGHPLDLNAFINFLIKNFKLMDLVIDPKDSKKSYF